LASLREDMLDMSGLFKELWKPGAIIKMQPYHSPLFDYIQQSEEVVRRALELPRRIFGCDFARGKDEAVVLYGWYDGRDLCIDLEAHPFQGQRADFIIYDDLVREDQMSVTVEGTNWQDVRSKMGLGRRADERAAKERQMQKHCVLTASRNVELAEVALKEAKKKLSEVKEGR
jgi:hypothetical protein